MLKEWNFSRWKVSDIVELFLVLRNGFVRFDNMKIVKEYDVFSYYL